MNANVVDLPLVKDVLIRAFRINEEFIADQNLVPLSYEPKYFQCGKIVQIKYRQENSDKKVSFILKKLEHPDELININRFVTEHFVHKKVLPALEAILKQKISPRLIFNRSMDRTIAYENYFEMGYELPNYYTGLDTSESKIAFQKLGQFHAATMVLIRDNQHLIEPFTKSIKEQSMLYLNNRFTYQEGCETLFEMLRGIDEYQNICSKLCRMKDTCQMRLEACLNRDSVCKVLNHGSLGVINYIFKKNNTNQATDMLFTNLHSCVYGSPTIDLQELMNISIDCISLINNKNMLLRIYYDSLITSLKLLGYIQVPSWEAIVNDFRATEFVGFLHFLKKIYLLKFLRELHIKNASTHDEELKRAHEHCLPRVDFRMLMDTTYSLTQFDSLGIFN